MTERSTRPASVRQQRLRMRQRRGEVVAPTPVSNDVIEALMDLGWLPPGRSESRQAIGAAIAAMLGDLARHLKKP